MEDTEKNEATTGSAPLENVLDRLIREATHASFSTADASDLAGNSSRNAAGGETASVGDIPAGDPSGTSATGSPLGALFGNPAMLSALPGLMNSLGPLFGSLGGGTTGGKPVTLPSILRHPDRHTALLCALKPYLGNERQKAAEYMIQLCRVWGAVQNMGSASATASASKSADGQGKEV